MINYKIFIKISLLMLLGGGTIIPSSNSLLLKNRKKLVILGYLREVADSLSQKNYDIEFLLKIVYPYCYSSWKMGSSFCSKKEQSITQANTILLSLAPSEPDAIITYRKGDTQLKQWKIGRNDLFLDSAMKLPCLTNDHIKDIVFLPPNHLFIGLSNGRLYKLIFLGKKLRLSNNTTQGSFFPIQNFELASLHELKINRMIAWGNQLLIIEPNLYNENYTKNRNSIKISKIQLKENKIYFDSTIRQLDLSLTLLVSRMSPGMGRENVGCYYLKYPFFEFKPNEQHINARCAIAQAEDGSRLFVHQEPLYDHKYGDRSCCIERKNLDEGVGSPSKYASVGTFGQFVMVKANEEEYACAYHVGSGKTYHKVMKLGLDMQIYDAFYLDEYTFILITMAAIAPGGYFCENLHGDPANLPFIVDRTSKGFGVQQVLLVQWNFRNDIEKFFSILEEEDEIKDDFTKRLYDWLKKTAGFDDYDYLVELLGDIIDDRSYRKQVNEELNELQGYSNQFDMTTEHLEMLKRTRERVNNLYARVIDYKVIQKPVYFYFFRGGCLVGGNKQGIHIFPINLH